MKTTIDIYDSLLEEVRQQASHEKTSVKALVEEGLRKLMADRKQKIDFRLRKATFKGSGLQAHLTDASWEQIREIAYKGRGG